ncbi:MAG: DUF86 domain-containing protein [Chloroflexi bacterium]|nr:DUF86 domain-containing protein [Chloroflexota bacterium]
MSDDPETRRLTYLRDTIALIEDRARAGRDALFGDVDGRDAMLWRLYTLADAASQLSDELKGRHPEIPWEQVRGFRNVAAHGYLRIALDLAWEIIETHLPIMKTAIERELRDRGPEVA